MFDEESKAVIPPVVVDLTVEAPLKTVAKDEKTLVLMKSLGISVAVDTFFSASTDFINIRTDAPDRTRVRCPSRNLVMDGKVIVSRPVQMGRQHRGYHV